MNLISLFTYLFIPIWVAFRHSSKAHEKHFEIPKDIEVRLGTINETNRLNWSELIREISESMLCTSFWHEIGQYCMSLLLKPKRVDVK